MQSEFYDNQRQEVVEDTFHKAILKHENLMPAISIMGHSTLQTSFTQPLRSLGSAFFMQNRGPARSKEN